MNTKRVSGSNSTHSLCRFTKFLRAPSSPFSVLFGKLILCWLILGSIPAFYFSFVPTFNLRYLSSWWKETWAHATPNLTCHCTENDIGKTKNLFDPHCLNLALNLSVCSVVVATDITDVRRGVLTRRHCAITRLHSDGSSVTGWKADILYWWYWLVSKRE